MAEVYFYFLGLCPHFVVAFCHCFSVSQRPSAGAVTQSCWDQEQNKIFQCCFIKILCLMTCLGLSLTCQT